MKKYRPNTKAVIVGIIFMLLGMACWIIKASFIPKGAVFLFPLGLLLICIGGLTLTITAFIAMRKNDLAMSALIKKQEEERKKAETEEK
ncbi:hypothetical protein [Lactobacillus ultunensis]|uniref:Uncharacterized protein n=1 Tax=Lactobacillus ultunensis DSM 16047 TaxID=525365 RepID=C2ELV1_9LACO|nr:hypothetical protein [Lactobacillus ultunensis]EEJ72523.1 hypothetical protein HMPREF0548_0647 [Lactobacillus ultunensis DSM 16047]KRL81942.1 hypothetical protein FC57_GL000303 [Lactobacillus ultunensis DSM 16047]QQP28073.1 hypothetical protein H4B44_08100 [Lactobacillus ultunensis]